MAAADEPGPSLRVVTMRCESASLLVDNADEWLAVGRGLVLNVSFFAGATDGGMKRAARKLLRLPLLSRGQWGDGHEPESVLKLTKEESGVDVLVVPQANMTGSASSKNQTVRYTDQLAKDAARSMYAAFCAELALAAAEALLPEKKRSNAEVEAEKLEREKRNQQDPSLTFRTGDFAGKYSLYDERGVPTHDAAGEPLAKAALKKCEKVYKARQAKFDKAAAKAASASAGVGAAAGAADVAAPAAAATDKPAEAVEVTLPPAEEAAVALPRILCGVFGNRQGFKMVSAGPTIHCFDL